MKLVTTDDARLFYQVSTNNWVAGENQTYSQVITLADAVADGNAAKAKVLKTSAAGLVTVTNVSLAAVGSITYTDTSNVSVPTIGAVATLSLQMGRITKNCFNISTNWQVTVATETFGL